MPAPQYAPAEDVWAENPEKHLEIIGIGQGSRKSKTLLKSNRAAYLLSQIRRHTRMQLELLRACHAEYNTRPRYEEDESGSLVAVGEEPEVLSDEELGARYRGVRQWQEIHQEIVDHNPSVGGFSIRATTHLQEDEKSRKARDSSVAEGPSDRW